LKYFLTCSATVYVVVNKYINKTQIYLQVLFGSDIDHYKKIIHHFPYPNKNSTWFCTAQMQY
jgi:hypothetical protein